MKTTRLLSLILCIAVIICMLPAGGASAKEVVPVYMTILSKPNKLSYFLGEPFDKTGLRVRIRNSDGSVEVLEADEVDVSEPDCNVTGAQNVTVSYNGISKNFAVRFAGRADVRSITVAKKPAKLIYKQGERYDGNGIVINALAANSSVVETLVEDDYRVMGFSTYEKEPGIYQAKVVYMGYYVTAFSYRVTNEKVISSFVISKPNKLVYSIGDELDITGMTASVKYYNGETVPISNDVFTFDGFDNTTDGVQSVNIYYQGNYVKSFTVKVVDNNFKCYNITYPTRREYNLGEELDTTGLSAAIEYKDGTTTNIPESVLSLDGYDKTTDGQQTVSVIYNNKVIGTFNVTVNDPIPKVGDTYTFGTYNDTSIEWQVLDREGGRVLVISKNVLFNKAYNDNYTSTSWSTSTLRTWLNGTFLKAKDSNGEYLIFNTDEQARILTTTVTGDNTKDKVFLLNTTEANQYFESNDARKTNPTSKWWLRTAGSSSSMYAAYVNNNGSINTLGYDVDDTSFGVRPAMWINLGSQYSTYIVQRPTKLRYHVGEEFSTTGLVVTEVFSDGMTKIIDLADITITGFNSQTTGVKTLSIKYNGITLDRFTVEIPTYTVTKPSKVEYSIGESFDKTGMTITANYEDGTTSSISNSLVTASGFDSTAVGTKTVKIKLNNVQIRTFTVTVSYAIGQYVSFGRYEQDKNMSNGKESIEWLILDKQDNNYLIISKCAIDCKKYNTSNVSVTWETCTLRTWLNGTFYNTAFNSTEQLKIQTTLVTADANPSYSTNPGNDTNDKVFLLSILEANKYFSTSNARMCVPTAYARANNATSYNGYCSWWVRSPGDDSDEAAYVSDGGYVINRGNIVYGGSFAVRPALWVNIE